MALPEIFGVPFWIALVIVLVGLFLIRAAFTLVKVLIIIAIALVVWFGLKWLLGMM